MEQDKTRQLELLRLKEARLKRKLIQFEAILLEKDEEDLFTLTRIDQILADLEKVNEQIVELL